MIHDEIVTGVYKNLQSLGVPVFKYEGIGTGERIVIQLKDNRKDIFQRGMVWVLVYVPKKDDLLPDYKRCEELKEAITAALKNKVVVSRGDMFSVREFGVTGPLSDREVPEESLYLLTYNILAVE